MQSDFDDSPVTHKVHFWTKYCKLLRKEKHRCLMSNVLILLFPFCTNTSGQYWLLLIFIMFNKLGTTMFCSFKICFCCKLKCIMWSSNIYCTWQQNMIIIALLVQRRLYSPPPFHIEKIIKVITCFCIGKRGDNKERRQSVKNLIQNLLRNKRSNFIWNHFIYLSFPNTL